jgi:hypothetical protein
LALRYGGRAFDTRLKGSRTLASAREGTVASNSARGGDSIKSMWSFVDFRSRIIQQAESNRFDSGRTLIDIDRRSIRFRSHVHRHRRTRRSISVMSSSITTTTPLDFGHTKPGGGCDCRSSLIQPFIAAVTATRTSPLLAGKRAELARDELTSLELLETSTSRS